MDESKKDKNILSKPNDNEIMDLTEIKTSVVEPVIKSTTKTTSRPSKTKAGKLAKMKDNQTKTVKIVKPKKNEKKVLTKEEKMKIREEEKIKRKPIREQFLHNKEQYDIFYQKELESIPDLRRRELAKKWLEEVLEIYGYQFKYYIGSFEIRKKAIIMVCDKGHALDKIPSIHCGNCSECNGKAMYTNYGYIQAVRKIKKHKGRYEYHLTEYKGMEKDIIVWCNYCMMSFSINANNHFHSQQGHDCHEIYKKLTHEDFVKRANDLHKNEYEYPEKYIVGRLKINILHKNCGKTFLQRPAMHLIGNGCNYCYGKVARTVDELKEYLQYYWGDLYDYSKITKYKNNKERFDVICNSCNKIFDTNLKLHIDQGRGCRFCSAGNYSKISLQWLEYRENLDNVKIIHAGNDREFQIPNTKYKADGYCKETNTIYEFHGDHWHGNPATKNLDKINQNNNKKYSDLYDATLQKEKIIKNLGYNYISIWENDWRIHCNKELVKKGTNLYVCTLCGHAPYKTKDGYDTHVRLKHLSIQNNEDNETYENDCMLEEINNELNNLSEELNNDAFAEDIHEDINTSETAIDNVEEIHLDNIKEIKEGSEKSNITYQKKIDSQTSTEINSNKVIKKMNKIKNIKMKSNDSQDSLDIFKRKTKGPSTYTFNCPKCEKIYKTVANLNKHIKKDHNGSDADMIEKSYQCNLCDKKFTRYHNLKHHKLSHNVDK